MKKLRWLINRLRQMSSSEVIFRLKRAGLQQVEKRKVLSGWQPSPEVTVTSKSALFGTNIDVITKWNSHHILDVERLDQYLAGKIDFFGHDYLDIGMPVLWHTDPVTKIVSPLEFGKSLDYRNDKKVGNVKFVWEMGRHQHLVPMAVAYAVTGDIKYRDAITGQIDSWIASNPYGMGIHWCSSLEVALRLISWSLVHSFIAIRDGKNGILDVLADPLRFGVSVYQHAFFIRNYLSLYSSANNHLIGELTGLWTACQVFDLGKEGSQWSEFSLRELENQSRLQVYNDGVNKEQAFYYHLWVLEYFIFAWLVGCHTSKIFSQSFVDKIERMSAFIKSVSPVNGCPPQIGDADDGFVARFEPNWPKQPYKEILSVFDNLSKNTSEYSTQKAFWYCAIIREELPVNSLTDSWVRQYPELYPEGGYGLLGNDDVHIVFDGGDLGYLAIAAHGHADALSFCLAIDGDWWLIDPGTYAYHSEERWRSYFRGTSAHNTIKINDFDQSVIAGAFMWSRKASANISKCSIDDNVQSISAIHDGYDEIGVSHKREIKFIESANELCIEDLLKCLKSVKAEINFHFSPDVSLEFDENEQFWVAKHRKSSRKLIFILDSIWNVDSVKGQNEPILGWYSPALEEKVATWVLHGVADISGATHSITRILIK